MPRVAVLLLLACSLAVASGPEDPMRPAPSHGTAFAADGSANAVLHLTATMVGPDSAVAILNGRRVRMGDTLFGVRVVRIQPGRIVLRHDGETQTLWVNATRVKSSATRNKKTSP